MALLENFQFSQSSLFDYTACPRRFQLRYLRALEWPAVQSEPVQEAERLARLGLDFHRLVHQHLIGLDEEALTASLAHAEPELRQWWQSYLAHRSPELTGAVLYPELTLSTPLRGYRLLARFDLLALLPNNTFLIVDWKTARRKPRREILARRLQTKVYPYVLALAGAAYNRGQPLAPGSISMQYWYPATPDQPETFVYSPQLLRRDEEHLSDLIEQIKHAATADEFPLVDDDRACAYCRYRSLCDRGQTAGPLAQFDDEAEDTFNIATLDWEQIAEIQF